VPYYENEYWYYSRFEPGMEYAIECRKKLTLAADEEILFDVNEMSKGQEYFSLTNFEISPDNNFVAYCYDNIGRKQNSLLFRDLRSGQVSSEKIYPVSGDFAWAKDNKTIFYVVNDETTLRPCKVYRHRLGDDPVKDELVFEEKDETFEVSIEHTKSQKFLVITSGSTLTTEQLFLPADKPDKNFTVFQKRKRGIEYYADELNGEFFIITNYNAKNFRLMKTPVDKTEIANWVEVIAHRENVLLEDADLFDDYVVLEEHKDGLTYINVVSWKTLQFSYIEFADPAYMVSLSYNPDVHSHKLRFLYTSLTTPDTLFEIDMKTGIKKVLKQREIPGGYNPNHYTAERIFVEVRDGVRVPVSLVYKNGMQKNGDNPLLLYSYGAYGVSNDPEFYSDRISLLDRGFIYALAHIRGGQEMGREWYEDGRLLKKKNTFFDFIDCADYLVQQKYTRKEKLFAEGMSAGGLLMGAVANMRPDLWNAVVAHVPFVDCVTTMLDESLPLTTGEYDEWGNPNEKEYYFYIKSYSPYDNIEKKDYPAILATTALSDSQVQYWEPAKWIAKLRDYNTGDNPVFLQTEIFAGHFGKSGRFEQLRLVALEYAFILDRLGIHQ
jgi:oligopeptidase B